MPSSTLDKYPRNAKTWTKTRVAHELCVHTYALSADVSQEVSGREDKMTIFVRVPLVRCEAAFQIAKNAQRHTRRVGFALRVIDCYVLRSQ